MLPKSYHVAPEGSVSLETLETTLERSFQRTGLEGAAAAAASVVSSVEGGVESADVAANAEEHTVHEDLGRALITQWATLEDLCGEHNGLSLMTSRVPLSTPDYH